MKVSSDDQRGLSIANHLASTDNLTKTTNTYEHIAEYNHTKRNPTKRRYAMNPSIDAVFDRFATTAAQRLIFLL